MLKPLVTSSLISLASIANDQMDDCATAQGQFKGTIMWFAHKDSRMVSSYYKAGGGTFGIVELWVETAWNQQKDTGRFDLNLTYLLLFSPWTLTLLRSSGGATTMLKGLLGMGSPPWHTVMDMFPWDTHRLQLTLVYETFDPHTRLGLGLLPAALPCSGWCTSSRGCQWSRSHGQLRFLLLRWNEPQVWLYRLPLYIWWSEWVCPPPHLHGWG